MKWPPALLVFSSTTCLLTAGCVASISDTPSSKSPVLHLEFARDGQELRLASGSSANPKTAYPNPTQLDRLHCTVLGNGSIKQTCERGGEKVSCIDPPIFTTIKDDKVVVVDLHGTQLGEIPFEHNSSKPPAENTVNPPNPDSDEAPPPGETKSCQSSEFSTCPDAGNTDKPSEAGSCPSVAAVKASYCAQVNGNLKKAGSSYVLECSRLKDPFDLLKDFESICTSELTLESELPRITRSCDSLTHQQYNEDIDQTEMWETQYSSCEEGHAGDLVEKLIDWDTQARQIVRCVGL